jgi:hypothetical protein
VELYHGGAGTTEDALRRGVVNSVITQDGRYNMCLPPSDGEPGPEGGAGLSARGGEIFVLRVVKAGYREFIHAFREGYSHWDYHFSTHHLEITRQ